MLGHHTSIRTADIHRAIAFYQVLGFEVEERFTTGYTLACWLQGPAGRLELIQIPEPSPPPDAFGDPHYVGYYHLSFDLTASLEPDEDLATWIASLRQQMLAAEIALQVLLLPCRQRIGDRTYEVTFLADLDGLPLEFLRELGADCSTSDLSIEN
jgi:catechol 2,3-dioxygenase-like lactoylglutathione lyase family enzyme